MIYKMFIIAKLVIIERRERRYCFRLLFAHIDRLTIINVGSYEIVNETSNYVTVDYYSTGNLFVLYTIEIQMV